MKLGELTLDVAHSRGLVRIDWRGRSADSDPEATIGPFLKELLHRARSSRSRVEMHFEALEFFNSATISLVIQYVQELREQKVPVHVHYAATMRWQRIFFDALRMFEGPGVLEVTQVD